MHSTSAYVTSHRGDDVPLYSYMYHDNPNVNIVYSCIVINNVPRIIPKKKSRNRPLLPTPSNKKRSAAPKRMTIGGDDDDPGFWDDPYWITDTENHDDPGFWDDPYWINNIAVIDDPMFWGDPYWITDIEEHNDPGFWDDPYYPEEYTPVGDIPYIFTLLLSVAYVVFRRKEKI